MSNLEPKLEHNRKEYDRLNTYKLRACIVIVALSGPLFVLVPNDPLILVMSVLLGAVAVIIFYFDVRRFRVYQRDLRERRDKGS